MKLGFAITINKSQGQSFENKNRSLQKCIQLWATLYCLFTRSWEALKVYLGNRQNNEQVKNYVYKEIYI